MALASHRGIYDTIGQRYSAQRVPDPRIAAQITAALGDARSVCNLGAGAGSYEPGDREVTAVEPSWTMLRQRAGGRAVRAVAEALPFADGAFDAAMTTLTVHHWEDVRTGLAEMARIAPRRVVFCFDLKIQQSFWLLRDYVPAMIRLDRARSLEVQSIADALAASRVEVVPVPWDCSDGFGAAYWRRPERYLDPAVRASISGLAQLAPEQVEPGMRRLASDIESGAWSRRNAELLERDAMDYGYRLVVTD